MSLVGSIPIKCLRPNRGGEKVTDRDNGMTPDQYALYCGVHDQAIIRYGLTIKARDDPRKNALFNCVSNNYSFTLTQGMMPEETPLDDIGDYHFKPLTNGNIAVRFEKASVRIKQA